jgi:hypothetical protein
MPAATLNWVETPMGLTSKTAMKNTAPSSNAPLIHSRLFMAISPSCCIFHFNWFKVNYIDSEKYFCDNITLNSGFNFLFILL